MTFPKTNIQVLADQLTDEELQIGNQANALLAQHIQESTRNGGTAALHIELAARELAIALDLVADWEQKNNPIPLGLTERPTIDICVERANEIRRAVR